MSSSDGHPEYDANLLSTAPAPTRGMVQSGYATDLLQDKPNPSKTPGDLEAGRHKSVLRPNRANPSVEGTEPSTAFIRTKLSPSTEKRPFYRTTKGIIILIIVAIVILAAIIGGAVGASLASKKRVDVTQVPTTNHTGDATPASVEVGRPSDVVSSVSAGVAVSVVRLTTTVGPTPSPTTSLVSPPGPSGSPGGGVIPVPTLTF